MKIRPQIQIQINHPLALDSQKRLSCLLLTLSQLALGANLTFVYGGLQPIFFYAIALIAWGIEKSRQKPLAYKAVKFCRNRLILHASAITIFIAVQSTLGDQKIPFGYWNFLIFTLVPLSMYDAFSLAEGKLGLTLKIKSNSN